MKAGKILILLFVVLFVSAGLWAWNDSNDSQAGETQEVMFTGKEDHSISLEEAAGLTENYRENVESGTKIAGFFGREAIEEILDQEGCVGIRYYYADMDDGYPVMILVGVDALGNDMIHGKLAERSIACPPWCSEENELTGENKTMTAELIFNR
ncbi:MAG: hypothetical protein GWN01_04155 [Nitrosopumilaceae archaeon]|nr:hypothetical protein [Nitrosopumilaceae archaeon]NIU86547.1 hypothetical protein [Nitrosopumilaceae archaeon]NIX60747.1 hypothetical protein [Nitrosopumilaceae archaeon]